MLSWVLIERSHLPPAAGPQVVRRHFAIGAQLSHPFGHAVGSAQIACLLTCLYLWRR